jgi:predicted  nucleic acid-binding Zn-ribbon protein
MNILAALKQEEKKLQHQLSGIQSAIAALNGRHNAVSAAPSSYREPVRRKRTLSAAARAKISRAAKERWARVRAGKNKTNR